MNKYIQYDLHSGTTLIKCAIKNALHDIESGEETEINLGCDVARHTLESCIMERYLAYYYDSKEKCGYYISSKKQKINFKWNESLELIVYSFQEYVQDD